MVTEQMEQYAESKARESRVLEQRTAELSNTVDFKDDYVEIHLANGSFRMCIFGGRVVPNYVYMGMYDREGGRSIIVADTNALRAIRDFCTRAITAMEKK